MSPLVNPPQTEFRWASEALFASFEDWGEELHRISEELPAIQTAIATISVSGAAFYQVLHAIDVVQERAGRLHLYAELRHCEDTREPEAAERFQQSQTFQSSIEACISALKPRILELDKEKITAMLSEEPRLEAYRKYLESVERHRPHTRSREVEEVIATFSATEGDAEGIHTALNNADLVFRPIHTAEGTREVSQGSIESLLSDPSRPIREQAFHSYYQQYEAHQHTFARVLGSCAKYADCVTRARRFGSTLERCLFDAELPENAFYSVLDATSALRPLFQRYFRARTQRLGVDTLQEWDLFAPLARHTPSIAYTEARGLVLDALSPLGEEYVTLVRRGLFEERWVDVFPRPGKYNNAFSTGAYGARPYILLNWSDSMTEVGTLAHELGHSAHTQRCNETQPFCYTEYSDMVAETASNLNQVLLRAHMLRCGEAEASFAVLDEAFYFAHRYLFLFPTLSEVEHHVHQRYGKGEAVSTEELQQKTAEAFRVAYNDSVQMNPYSGIKWAPFVHFYQPYYLFTYAVGICAAFDIGARLLEGETGLAARYDRFLRTGKSLNPVETFKIVGVDITSPSFSARAAKTLEGYVRTLEILNEQQPT